MIQTGRVRNASFDVDGDVGRNIIAVSTTTRQHEDEDAEDSNLSRAFSTMQTHDVNEEQQEFTSSTLSSNNMTWRRNLKRGSKVYVWYVEESRWIEGEIVEVEIRGDTSKQYLRVASVVEDETVIFKIRRNSKHLADAELTAHIMNDGISDLLNHIPMKRETTNI